MPPPVAHPGELREDEDYTTALYRAAIGPVNTDDYLALFSTWETRSRWQPHWNSAAGFWTLGWMAFRQMGGAALAYTGALVGSALLLFGVLRLWINPSETGLMIMFIFWLLLAVLVPGLWGTAWFHGHCRKRMAAALAAHTEVAQSCAALARQSSQPRRAMMVGGVQAGLLLALGLSAMQFSSLMQRAGLHLASASALPPQMASGKLTELPLPVAAAPAVPARPPSPVIPASPASAVIPAASAVSAPVAVAVAVAAPKSLPRPAPSASASAAPASQSTTPAAKVAAGVAAVAPGRFGVNVGLFAKAANAQNVQAKLEAAGLPTRVDTLQMKRGPRTRIRVGPFASQAQADAAATQIKALGLEAQTYGD